MNVVAFIYDSRDPGRAVDSIRQSLEKRDESIEHIDIGADGSVREAMLLVGESTRIGPKPDGLFDESGDPDFSAGVLITEQDTGRRNLSIGDDMLDVL